MRRPAWLAAGLALAVAALPGGGAAQTLPGSVEPGRVQQRLQPPPAAPAPEPPLGLPALPESLPPEQAGQIRFPLRQVVIEGATAYTAAQLRPLYAGMLERVVSLAAVYRIADTITRQYRSDGYILSRAVVPAQRIVDGTVRIQVIEGYVAEVVLEGSPAPQVAAYAERLTRIRPLTAAALERYLLLINDLPGVSARAVLSPAAGTTGGSVLTVVVARAPVDLSLGLDNRGSKYLGPVQLLSGAALNDALGPGDRLAVRYIVTPQDRGELRYADAGYSLPLGGEGLRLTVFASGNRSRPGSTLNSDLLETKAKGFAATVGLSYPVIRSRSENLVADASFTLRNAAVDQYLLPGGTRLSSSYDDRLRVLRAGLSYDTLDRWGGTDFLRGELSQGLPVLGASADGSLTDSSRPGGQTVFSKLTADAYRLQDLSFLTDGLRLLTSGSAAWAFRGQLLASEQFGVGGATFGRGYDPSELTGDYGAAATAELQYALGPGRQRGWPDLQAYGFYDFGVVVDQEPERLNATDGRRSLASAGLGLRSVVTDWLRAGVELAKPLTRPVAAEADTTDPKPLRLYFSLFARF